MAQAWAQQQQWQQQQHMQAQQQWQQQQAGGQQAQWSQQQASASRPTITVSGCQNQTVANIISGSFQATSENHGKPVYQKQGGDPSVSVLIYFWDQRDGPTFSGWWFGPRVGGDQVWAYNTDQTSTLPPVGGWKVPWDGPVDDSLKLTQQQSHSSNGAAGATGSAAGGKGQEAKGWGQQQQSWGQQQGWGQQQSQQQAWGGDKGWQKGCDKGWQKGGWEEGKGGWQESQQAWGDWQKGGKPQKGDWQKGDWSKGGGKGGWQQSDEEKQKQEAARQALMEQQKKREEERKQKEEEMKRRQQEKEEEMQKRQAELKKKREEEEQRRQEQAAALIVRKVVQRVRIATPENYDELRTELEKALEEQLEKMGAQAEKVQQEAEKALLQAQERVDQITEKRQQEEKEKEEAAIRKKEEAERMQQISKEAAEEVQTAETKVTEMTEGVKIEDSEEPESVLEAVQKSEEVTSELQSVMEGVSKSLQEKRDEMNKAEAQEEKRKLKEEFDGLFKRIAACRRKIATLRDTAKSSKERATRKAKMLKREKAVTDLFNKFDKDKDGKLKRAEIIAFSKGHYDFEIKADVIDKILRQLAKDDVGVPLSKFSRCKAMVAISRSEVKARIKRAEEAEKERIRKEEAAKRAAELEAKKEGIQKVFTQAADLIKSAESASLKAEELTARFDGVIAKDDLSSSEISEASDKARDSATESRGQVAAAREKLEEASELEADDEDLQIWKDKQASGFKARITRVETQLDRVDAAVKVAEEKAKKKAYAEFEALKTATITSLREIMCNDSISGTELFERMTGGASDEMTCEKFATFIKSLPSPEFKDGQAEKLFSHVTGDVDKLTKEKFTELIRMFYKVVNSSVLTEEAAIKSKTLRRLEVGEIVEAVDTPKKDAEIGVTRMKCKSVSDNMEGYVTIAGNQGKVFLAPGGSTFKCIKDTFITQGLSVVDTKNVRKIKVGEVVDILEFDTLDESCNVKRIKIKAKNDGATGWVTLASNAGTPFMEPC